MFVKYKQNATVTKTKFFLELNKALVHQNQKVFKIFRQIKSYGTCMEY